MVDYAQSSFLYQRRLECKRLSHDCCCSWNFIVSFPNEILLQVGLGNPSKVWSGDETRNVSVHSLEERTRVVYCKP